MAPEHAHFLDGDVAAPEETAPATGHPVALVPAAPMSTEEHHEHGDLDCSHCVAQRQVYYRNDELDVIFRVHADAVGTLKHAKFVVKHRGVAGQAPSFLVFTVNLSARPHGWLNNFIAQVMERMCNDTRGQTYAAFSTFFSTVCRNSVSPPPPINSDPYYSPVACLLNKPSQLLSFPSGQSISAATVHIHMWEENVTDENSVDEYPPWTDLLPEIYGLILDHLNAYDTLTFPLVCRSWESVYAQERILQPGTPTLLTSPSDYGWDFQDDFERGLFFINNILSMETFCLEVETLGYKNWIGGKDEWLVTSDLESNFQLLNPITGASTTLPPITMIHGKRIDLTWYSLRRIQLCRAPTEDGGYFAIAIFSQQHLLAYTMAGSNHWIMLDNPIGEVMNYSDSILHKGKIIAICRNGDLWSWDLVEEGKNPNLLLRTTIRYEEWEEFDFILAPSVCDNLLIISPYGSIPFDLIRRSCHTPRNLLDVKGAVLSEVDTDAKTIEVVRDIGDRSLFLGPNYPFYVRVLVPSGDLKKNHVYMADVSYCDAAAIDLTQKNLPNNITLIMYPTPSNPCQVPMWFQPSFRRMLAKKMHYQNW